MAPYDDGRPASVRRYLLDGERCVVTTHRHWVVMVEPWLTVLGSMLLVAWLTFDVADPRTSFPVDLLWWLWFALVGRAAWLSMDRARTWFIATDRRLLLVYGVVVRHVAMMPLAKVTDMHYQRSPLGHVLGYGTFVLESAGQDQALREIEMVPHPDANYRAIIDKIFHTDADDVAASAEGDDGDRDGDDYPYPSRPDGWEEDPTSSFALGEEETNRWRDRLRGRVGGMRDMGGMGAVSEAPRSKSEDKRGGLRRVRGALRGRRSGQRPPTASGVGATHAAADDWSDDGWSDDAWPGAEGKADPRGSGWRDRSLFDPDDADAESLYRSRPDDESPRDATGYWK